MKSSAIGELPEVEMIRLAKQASMDYSDDMFVDICNISPQTIGRTIP